MSAVAEITNKLSDLSTDELQQVEAALISIYRQRKSGIIYDDDYGVWTEQDQRAAADRAFQLFDADGQRGKKPDHP